MGRHGCGGGGGGYGRGRYRRGRGGEARGSCLREPAPQPERLPRVGTESSKGAATELGKAETLAELRQQAEVVAQQLNEARSRLSTAAQRQVAVVKRDSCTICGICASSCPNDAIAVTDVVAVDASRCSGCGACVYVCPSGAIQLERP